MLRIMETPAAAGREGTGSPQYRYPGVLALTFATVVFLIAAPTADWTRAVAIALEGLALVVTVGTSRARPAVRRHRAIMIGLALAVWVLLIAAGALPLWMTVTTG